MSEAQHNTETGVSPEPLRIQDVKFVLLPGNMNPLEPFWMKKLGESLRGKGSQVIDNMPPSRIFARRSKRIPYLESLRDKDGKSFIDEKTVLVGHSSGAIAILDFLQREETPHVLGIILLNPYYTPLRYLKIPLISRMEEISGYFGHHFLFGRIKEKTRTIAMGYSGKDEFLDEGEKKGIREALGLKTDDKRMVNLPGGHNFVNTRKAVPIIEKAIMSSLHEVGVTGI